MISPISSVGINSNPPLPNSQQGRVEIQFVSENIVIEKTIENKKIPEVSWERFRQRVLLTECVYLSEEDEMALCKECNEFYGFFPLFIFSTK